MQLIQLRLCHVPLIIIVSYFPGRIIANCADWSLKGSAEVCCNLCKPGNRLVEECGLNPSELCVPCSPNTYTNEALAYTCKKCTQCISPLIQLKPCNTSKDTVCGCKPGLRCGNEQCKFCVTECKVGEEPTNLRTCRDCPEGTFNNKIHSLCKPWSKRCPDGEIMTARGNKSSDIKCSKIPETTSSAPKEFTTLTMVNADVSSMKTLVGREDWGLNPHSHTPNCSGKPSQENRATYYSKGKYIWMFTRHTDNVLYLLLACFGVSSAITLSLILSIWYAYKRAKNKSKSKDLVPIPVSQGELRIIMVDSDEACSFCQPEQEQGGSSESINTQGSETKLIV